MTAAKAAGQLGFSRWHVCQLVNDPDQLLKYEKSGLKSGVDADLNREIVAGMKRRQWANAEALKRWLAARKKFMSKPGIYSLCTRLGVPFRVIKPGIQPIRNARHANGRLGRMVLSKVEVEAISHHLANRAVEHPERLRAILAVGTTEQGLVEISKRFQIHRLTLSRWIRNFRENPEASMTDRISALCKDRPHRKGRMSNVNLQKDFDLKFQRGEIKSADDVLQFLRDRKIPLCKKRTAYNYLEQVRKRQR
jgi:transposase-like protein